MFLKNLVLAHLFLVGQVFTSFLLLFCSQAFLLILVGSLPIHFTFDTRCAVVHQLILVLNFADALTLAYALCSLRLFDLLLSHCCLFAPLRIIVILLFFLMFGEVNHPLLLLHNLIEPLDLKLFGRAGPVVGLESLNFLDALIVADCLADNVLVPPILGAVLSHLQLNLERVERVNNILVDGIVFTIMARLNRLLALYHFILAGASPEVLVVELLL